MMPSQNNKTLLVEKINVNKLLITFENKLKIITPDFFMSFIFIIFIL